MWARTRRILSGAMKTAIYPGTFDPVTRGHMDVLGEASRVFSTASSWALASIRARWRCFRPTSASRCCAEPSKRAAGPTSKPPQFSGSDRRFRQNSGRQLSSRAACAPSPTSSMRWPWCLANEQLDETIKTVFLIPSHRHLYLSSSIVRQAAELGPPNHRRFGATRASKPSCARNLVFKEQRAKAQLAKRIRHCHSLSALFLVLCNCDLLSLPKMLKVENLSVKYGVIQALHEISLHVEEGEIVTLIGSNGAGQNHDAWARFRVCSSLRAAPSRFQGAGFVCDCAARARARRVGAGARRSADFWGQ